MDKKTRQRRDRLQNLLIVLLSVSALYLFSLTQSELLHWDIFSDTSALSGSSQDDISSGVSLLQELDWPVTLVVSDGAGDRRYQQLTTSDSAFTTVEGLWEDALRQITSSVEIDHEAFEAALALPGLYTAFPSPVPACILSARLGLNSEDETPLLRLLLAADSEETLLLFSTGEKYYRCATALTGTDLTSLTEQLDGASCLFSFEQNEESTLHPLTVLPDVLPQHRTMNAAASQDNQVTEELLVFFGFNAHTTNRYTEASGTEVVMESPRRLSVTPAGRVSYLGTVSYAPDGFQLSDSPSPTLSELVSGAYRLLQHMPNLCTGEERLYLFRVEISPEEELCTLRFSYMAHGLPIVCSDGSAAAEITVTDGIVTDLTVLCRSYTAADPISLLLPVRQASAIAANHAGLEMALSYVDSGSTAVSASWLMR